MTRIKYLTANQVAKILSNELSKNGSISLSSKRGTRVITAIQNGKIEYNHHGKTTKPSYYDIDLFVDTVNDFYGQYVTIQKLRDYNNAYTDSVKPCNAMLFFLLLEYLFGIVIYGRGVKGDPYYVFVQFHHTPFSSAYIPFQTVQPQMVESLYHECLSRLFLKNIILRTGNVFLSVLDVNDVMKAVKSAYLSMQPRTYKKDNERNVLVNQVRKDALLICLASRLVEFFSKGINNQHDFDEWHKDTCDWFLNGLNNILNQSGYHSIMYGKAQKIVNVAFKNLYLFDNAIKYEEQFKLCHFTIDSANLTWYNSFSNPKYVKAWSNMSYYDYMDIQNNIRKYLTNNKKYPAIPFYAEFYVWSDYNKW